jgi:hypothetical protein
MDTWRSKVRVRGGLWVRLGEAWGGELFIGKPILVFPYSDDPQESLFFMTVQLKEKCDKRRRYKFHLEGKIAPNGNKKFLGIERDLYYPSKDGFTRSTSIDLGYLDLCMADGNRCDEPYYPRGKATPPPRKS